MPVIAGKDYAFSPHLRTVLKGADRFRRIKIRAGFFRYRRAHLTARGPVGQAVRRDVGLAPAKDDLAAFTAFFARDPRLV